MDANLTKGGCGNCGHDQFKIYEKKDAVAMRQLFVECVECKNISIITFTIPQLEVHWADNSKGVLCFGW